jgi:hypothetical protein
MEVHWPLGIKVSSTYFHIFEGLVHVVVVNAYFREDLMKVNLIRKILRKRKGFLGENF